MKDLPTHNLTNLPPFSLSDIAQLHETTKEEVKRVATSLSLQPEGTFETEDFYRLNKVLMPVREPYQVTRRKDEE